MKTHLTELRRCCARAAFLASEMLFKSKASREKLKEIGELLDKAKESWEKACAP